MWTPRKQDAAASWHRSWVRIPWYNFLFFIYLLRFLSHFSLYYLPLIQLTSISVIIYRWVLTIWILYFRAIMGLSHTQALCMTQDVVRYVKMRPGYLADDCQLVGEARVRQLRSADTRTLVVSWTHNSFGDRTFAAAGPQVWNSLPPNLRLCGLSYGQFRRLLKTFLFGQ